MKKCTTFFYLILIATACHKPVTKPQDTTIYTDLSGREIKFNEHFSIDLNKDGVKDIGFYTLLVGDPIAQVDKQKYIVYSTINSFLPVDPNENAPILTAGRKVPLENFDLFIWYNVAEVELAQKIIPLTGPEYWEGGWKNSQHNFLPLQIMVDQKRYTGWVELSFDSDAGKIILHRAAISGQPETEILTGA